MGRQGAKFVDFVKGKRQQGSGTYKTTEELLQDLADTPLDTDHVKELKEEIVLRNIALVHACAREFISSGEPFEDLVSAGYIGLLNAVHNFEPERGLQFSTYATHLIKGEIRHHIRSRHLIKIPGWLVELSNKVKEVEDQLFKTKGRLPTIEELAAELNITEEGILEVLKAQASMSYISLDQERRKGDPRPQIDLEKIKSREPDDFPIEQRIRIAMAIEKLSEVQQEVIKGLFYADKTQAELGKELGYSQRHISRLKEECLAKIKEELLADREEEL